MKQRPAINSDQLTDFQTLLLVSSVIVGATIIYLPRSVTMDLGAAGLITILAGGVLAVIATVIIASLSSRFPNQTIAEYGNQLVGKFLNKTFNLGYVVYSIMACAFINRFFSGALKAFALERTPVEVISISMLLAVVYLVQHGINSIARICEAFMPFVLLIFALVIIVSFQNFQFKNLYPAFQIGLIPVFKAVPKTVFSYAGFEILLFICPFMKSPQNIVKYGAAGLIIPIIIYFFFVVLAIGSLGIETVRYTLFPVLTLTKAVEFPGGFGERFDLLFLAFWILAAFTSIAIYYYLASLSLTRIFELRNYKPFIYLLLPVVYFVSILPQNLVEVEKWLGYTGYLGAFFIFLLPLTFFLLAVIRKKGGKTGAKKGN